MAFKQVDRLPIIEWAGYWDKTLERWYSEGLSRDLNDDAAIRKQFGLDTKRFDYNCLQKAKCPGLESNQHPPKWTSPSS